MGRYMKCRFIFPAIYMLPVLLYFAFFIKGAGGHGSNPFEFVYYPMFPAGFFLELMPTSWAPKNDLLLVLLFVFIGLVQWVVMGYLIDRLVAWHLKKKS